MVKNLSTNAGDVRDAGSTPGSGRTPGGGYGNPLQYSFLENPMDRGAWRATIYRITVKHNCSNLAHTHTHTHTHTFPYYLSFSDENRETQRGEVGSSGVPPSLSHKHTLEGGSASRAPAWSPHSTLSNLHVGNPRPHHCSPSKAGMGEVQPVRRAWGDSGGLQSGSRKSVGTEGREEISLNLGLFPRLSSQSEAKL